MADDFTPSSLSAQPRLTALALAPDGRRLVAVEQRPDAKGARYASSLWAIPLGDGTPTRLTRSDKGETSPAFLPDGNLLFVSARPDADGEEDEAALWQLPATGEPSVLARSPGGVSGPVIAAGSGAVLLAASRLVDSSDADDDGQRRKDRKDRKANAILHTGMPIRHWDHELGDTSPRLLLQPAGGGDLLDLTPDAGQALHETSYSISADGRTVLAQWRVRKRGGRYETVVVAIDTVTGERGTLAEDPGAHCEAPKVSPDGRLVALVWSTDGEFDRPMDEAVQVRAVDGSGEPVRLELGEVYPSEFVWSPDSAVLFLAGDFHGRGAVLAIDAASGSVIRRLASDASYSSLCPAPDGSCVYALRSALDMAPTPVRLDAAVADQQPHVLATPAPTPELPGRLVEVETTTPDGASVHGWLCLPDRANPPVMLWVHGGPFGSWNAWSWRWNPWAAVVRGYAVLLPDPALSTGYGPGWIARAWPHRAGIVWADLEAMLDDALERFALDHSRTACLGASFGGYMTNWIAGHTDRFRAIVTHAGLWALDQQHTTTDGAQWKTGLFGTPAQHPDWYADNSPHNFIDKINTPMLVSHGNRDYRVPISEALRLWWDLVSHFDGEPDALPHRFLQLTGENHWVLSPANAQIWYQTVLDFCDQHVRG